MIWKCEKCGLELKDPMLPVFCCGGSSMPKVCTHRGPAIGSASCGCGSVYPCGLYGGYCTARQPPDEWATVTIDGVKREIRDLVFHACQGCEGFTSSSPSTTTAQPPGNTARQESV